MPSKIRQREYNRRYYARHTEQEKRCTSEYRRNNPERYRELDRKRYQTRKGHKKEYDKKYAITNSDRIKAYQKQYREAHKEENRKYNIEYRIKNKKRISQTRKLSQTPETRKKAREWRKSWLDNNPTNKLIARLRSLIRHHIKKTVNGSSRYLDYSIGELKKHIESKFKDGMCWERLSEIHLDHIIPLKYKLPNGDYYWNQEELADPTSNTFKEAWGLDNLQPLWGHDNLKKNCYSI